MLKVLRNWVHRYFSDEQAVVLAVILLLGFTAILTLGGMLAPVLAGLVLAFLMQGLVNLAERLRLSHTLAVWLVFTLFIGLLAVCLLVLLPLMWRQLSNLVNELPRMLGEWQTLLLVLPERYPLLLDEQQVLNAIEAARGELGKLGQWALTISLSSLPMLINIMIYLVLVPILVFFFLKDGSLIARWMSGYLPQERALMTRVWQEMHLQIANYIRGKVIEIFICAVVTYIAFAYLGLNYAALLALLVGLSVVVPYIGAVVVTVPVALIGLFQWGMSDQFIYLMVIYGIIQALDGNVLVPLLFSEAVSLHPVAIICAVLLFGGLWGFWGVFFAIPLATLCKAVLTPGRGASYWAASRVAGGVCRTPPLGHQPCCNSWAACRTAAACPGTLTPRHSWRNTPCLSIRKVLRSMPMYSLP